MPSIPATRQKKLRRPENDIVQWKLTNCHEKSTHHPTRSPSQSLLITTIDIAKNFLDLLINQANVISR